MEKKLSDRSFYQENGWLFLEQLFDSEVMKYLKFQIHDIFKSQMERCGIEVKYTDVKYIDFKCFVQFYEKNRTEYIGCMKAIQNIPVIYSLASSDKILDTLKKVGLKAPLLAGKPIILMNSEQTSSITAYWKTPAHQDWRSIQGSLNGVVVWIAIDDLPKERGPLEGISGSHKWGLLETENDEWYKHCIDSRVKEESFEVVPVRRPGDAVIQSVFHVHRSGINRSDNFRYTLVFRFNDAQDEYYIDHAYPTTYAGDSPVVDLIGKDNVPTVEKIEISINA